MITRALCTVFSVCVVWFLAWSPLLVGVPILHHLGRIA